MNSYDACHAYRNGAVRRRFVVCVCRLPCARLFPPPSQANLEGWAPILDHIDDIMEKTLTLYPYLCVCSDVDAKGDAARNDGAVSGVTAAVGSDEALVEQSLRLFQCLRFTLLLLQHAKTKTAYSSMEVSNCRHCEASCVLGSTSHARTTEVVRPTRCEAGPAGRNRASRAR